MKASDIAKLAASITAGQIAYDSVIEHLSSGDASLLDQIIAGGAGIAAGGIVSELMDGTGVSDLIDDTVDELFDW